MRKHWWTCFKCEENGQAMVEFALTIPIVLAIICGILELGVACANQLEVANVCRETTRYGIAYTTETNHTALIQARAYQLASARMQPGLSVVANYSRPEDIRTGDLIVTVTYKAKTLTPLSGIFAGDTYTVQSTCTMKMS